MNQSGTITIKIRSENDARYALVMLRSFAAHLDVPTRTVSRLMTALSELTRNILKYAEWGTVEIRRIAAPRRHGVQMIVSDHGPGIPDIDAALQDSMSTGGTLGLGLPGVKRLMSEFAIESQLGRGTRVTVTQWLQP